MVRPLGRRITARRKRRESARQGSDDHPGAEGQRNFNHLRVKFARTLSLRVTEAWRTLPGKASEAESSNRRYGFLQRQSRRIRIAITTVRTTADRFSTKQQSGGAEPAEGFDVAKDRGSEIKDARKRDGAEGSFGSHCSNRAATRGHAEARRNAKPPTSESIFRRASEHDDRRAAKSPDAVAHQVSARRSAGAGTR